MSRFDAEFITAATGGQLRGAAFAVDRVGKDTRADLSEALYVAIAGENFDGHDYVTDAFAAGARAALVDAAHAERLVGAGPLVVVDETGRALLDLAAAHLARCPARRLALTGSNGKTTTKEMIAAVCRQAFGSERVLATAGNLNNLIGMPLTALELSEQAEIAVLEMGMNRLGEIAAMAAAARPHVGLIVNVQPAHLEGLGDIEAVARAKGELFDALEADAVAVVNLDDPRCRARAETTRARRLGFGEDSAAAARLLQTVPVTGGQRIRLGLGDEERELSLRHEGKHNALNATAAAACGLALGLDVDTICAGLEAAPVVGGRLARRQVGPIEIIDDTYNANPASMRAALAVAGQRPAGRRLHLVLGEMRELGATADALHAEVGAAAAATDPIVAYLCGAHAEAYRSGAETAGLSATRIQTAEDAGELAPRVAQALQAGDLVLIKGSRGARMERVVEEIERAWGGAGEEGR